jgi:hypothetical protein
MGRMPDTGFPGASFLKQEAFPPSKILIWHYFLTLLLRAVFYLRSLHEAHPTEPQGCQSMDSLWFGIPKTYK